MDREQLAALRVGQKERTHIYLGVAVRIQNRVARRSRAADGVVRQLRWQGAVGHVGVGSQLYGAGVVLVPSPMVCILAWYGKSVISLRCFLPIIVSLDLSVRGQATVASLC